jgi:ferrous iron transport protein B
VGLLERAQLFLNRAGTVILTVAILLWFMASYPKPPASAPVDSLHTPISYSYAGILGRTLEPLVKPIGFDWRIAVALIPGFAAREVMIGALGTVYAVEGGEDHVAQALGPKIAHDWTLATALSLMVWYVLALQCVSTVAVTRRETNSWRWPAFMLGYITVLAYSASFVTYHFAVWMGWG